MDCLPTETEGLFGQTSKRDAPEFVWLLRNQWRRESNGREELPGIAEAHHLALNGEKVVGTEEQGLSLLHRTVQHS